MSILQVISSNMFQLSPGISVELTETEDPPSSPSKDGSTVFNRFREALHHLMRCSKHLNKIIGLWCEMWPCISASVRCPFDPLDPLDSFDPFDQGKWATVWPAWSVCSGAIKQKSRNYLRKSGLKKGAWSKRRAVPFLLLDLSVFFRSYLKVHYSKY